MKTKTTFKLLLQFVTAIIGLTHLSFAQSNNSNFWAKNGNAVLGNGNTLGTFYLGPINIYTNGVNTAIFSVNNGLGGGFLPTGDGLKIKSNQSPPGIGDLDLWVDGPGGFGYGTHIKWDGSGLIQRCLL